jgi:hypothetical protein
MKLDLAPFWDRLWLGLRLFMYLRLKKSLIYGKSSKKVHLTRKETFEAGCLSVTAKRLIPKPTESNTCSELSLPA